MRIVLFSDIHGNVVALEAVLGRNVTIEDVGNMATWLCSDWAAAVTGETIYVDAGLHHIAASQHADSVVKLES